MSKLLDQLIRQRREEVIAYGEFLKKVTTLAKKVKHGEGGPSRPAGIDSSALRAIYDNLPEAGDGAEGESETDSRESVALAIDRAVRDARMAGWRGHRIKELQVKSAIHKALGPLKARTEEFFDIVKAQGGY